HLNQLRARRRAALRVAAFRRQELLFGLVLSLTRSRFFHRFSRVVSPIHLNQLQARRRATLRVVAFRQQELLFDLALSLSTSSYTSGYTLCRGFPLAGVFIRSRSIAREVVQFSIGFHAFLRSLQSVSINFELHFVSWLSVAGVLARNNSIILHPPVNILCIIWLVCNKDQSNLWRHAFLVHIVLCLRWSFASAVVPHPVVPHPSSTPSSHTPSSHTPSSYTPSSHTPSSYTPSSHTPS
ncbi:hypothetical protein BS47DRAFT_1402221, partial [Hydnum rufescens UP504]